MDDYSGIEGRASEDTVHGGRPDLLKALFPGAPDPFVDLSTGINPHAYPIEMPLGESFQRLPNPVAHDQLERAAAKAYGATDPRSVVAAPGTQAIISLLPHLIAADTVAVLSPTYSEYAKAWRAQGAAVQEVSSLAALAAADVALLCNPNNPDGQRYAPDALVDLAQAQAAKGGWLIVDEAFADLEDGPLTVIDRLPIPGLIVLRSFGKTYGLAGLRLGFAVTSLELASALRHAFGPWAVSGPALEIGTKALRDQSWRGAMKRTLDDDVARLDALLTDAGLTIKGGTRLFRLAEGNAAPEIFDRLGRAGILVRRFDYNPHWLRVGIPGTQQEWARLSAALT